MYDVAYSTFVHAPRGNQLRLTGSECLNTIPVRPLYFIEFYIIPKFPTHGPCPTTLIIAILIISGWSVVIVG
jgi:hypothetical protein